MFVKNVEMKFPSIPSIKKDYSARSLIQGSNELLSPKSIANNSTAIQSQRSNKTLNTLTNEDKYNLVCMNKMGSFLHNPKINIRTMGKLDSNRQDAVVFGEDFSRSRNKMDTETEKTEETEIGNKLEEEVKSSIKSIKAGSGILLKDNGYVNIAEFENIVANSKKTSKMEKKRDFNFDFGKQSDSNDKKVLQQKSHKILLPFIGNGSNSVKELKQLELGIRYKIDQEYNRLFDTSPSPRPGDNIREESSAPIQNDTSNRLSKSVLFGNKDNESDLNSIVEERLTKTEFLLKKEQKQKSPFQKIKKLATLKKFDKQTKDIVKKTFASYKTEESEELYEVLKGPEVKITTNPLFQINLRIGYNSFINDPFMVKKIFKESILSFKKRLNIR